MPRKRKTKSANPVIVVAIIGLIGTILSIVLPFILEESRNTLAPTVTNSASTSVPSPTITTTIASLMTNIEEPTLSDAQFVIPITDITATPSPFENTIKFNPSWKSYFYLTDSLVENSPEFSNRVFQLPEDINPETNYEEIVIRIKNGDVENWLNITTETKLTLDVTNLLDEEGSEIKIGNEAEAEIFGYSLAPSHVNALFIPEEFYTIPLLSTDVKTSSVF